MYKKYGKYGQYFFYRCHACRSILDRTKIVSGGCDCRGGWFSPASLSYWEEFKLIVGTLWK